MTFPARRGTLLCALGLVAGAGCLKPEPVPYRVSMGMTEQKLFEAVGEPFRTLGGEQEKTLEYRVWVRNVHGREIGTRDWFVHLSHGRVDQVGWRPGVRELGSGDGPARS